MTFNMIYHCSNTIISYHTEAFVKTEVGCTVNHPFRGLDSQTIEIVSLPSTTEESQKQNPFLIEFVSEAGNNM